MPQTLLLLLVFPAVVGVPHFPSLTRTHWRPMRCGSGPAPLTASWLHHRQVTEGYNLFNIGLKPLDGAAVEPPMDTKNAVPSGVRVWRGDKFMCVAQFRTQGSFAA